MVGLTRPQMCGDSTSIGAVPLVERWVLGTSPGMTDFVDLGTDEPDLWTILW